MSTVRPSTDAGGLRDRVATVPGPLVFVAVGLAHLSLTQLGMWMQVATGEAPILWPAAGIGLAALLMVPADRWGWVLGAVALAELAGDLAWGHSVPISVGWTASSVLQPLVGALLLHRVRERGGALVPARQLVLFLASAVAVGPLVGATVAAAASATYGAGPFHLLWPGYFVGDALGVLVVAPVVLSVPRAQSRRSRRELTALVLSTTVACTVVFTGFGGSWMVTMPYVVVPFFVWAALRFGTFGTACMSLGVTALAGALTATGQGPFALAGGPQGTAVTLLQVFVAITVAFSLLLAALVADLGDRRQSEETLRHLATHDALTGLANRSRFAEEIERAMSLSIEPGRSTGLLVCDLDLFKAVNDRVGHKGGDDVLVEVAERLRGGVRAEDLVARISGDEFVVMLFEVDEREAEAVACRLADLVARPMVLERQREVRPSISIGAAVAVDGEDADSLFRVADAALYQAKRGGGGRVVVADEVLRGRARQQVQVEDDVRAAFAEEQMVCSYQPVVELGSGRLVGVEVAVCWRHPDLGLLDAERFLPAVDSMGLNDLLLETVLRQVLRAQKDWSARAGTSLPVSVNVSAPQLGSGGAAELVKRVLEEADVPAGGLSLQVTSVMPLDDLAVATLRRLHELGVRLVLGGLGAGMSSLERVVGVPWDLVKLDKTLVAGLPGGPATEDMVRAAVALAQALGIRTGADGVSRVSQLERLLQLGCEVGQGPLFGRPESADDLLRMLPSGGRPSEAGVDEPSAVGDDVPGAGLVPSPSP